MQFWRRKRKQMENIEKVTGKSMNLIDDNKKKIGELFPEVITESRDSNGELIHAINFEKLKQLLSDSLIDHNERYEFTWVGKNKAILEAGTPISKTLRPQKDKSVDWDHTENIYIEGDNLEALKLLQESYLNKIDVIYIDPPYNTGKDFIYNDNFKLSREEYEEMTNEFDEYNQRMVSSKKDSARFHSDWLNMMYSRLKLARNLLSDNGAVVISIDDNELKNLENLLDELYGEENKLSVISWRRTDSQSNVGKIARVKEYLLIYAKNIQYLKTNKLPLSNSAKKEYRYSDDNGLFRRGILLDKTRGRYTYPIITPSGNILKGPWMKSEEEFHQLQSKNLIYWTSGKNEQPHRKIYMNDSQGQIANDFWGVEFGTNQRSSQEIQKLFGYRAFDFSKPTKLIKSILRLLSHKDSIILDFFSGSGTTADAVMQLNAEDEGNRKFIMVQLPEKIDEKQEAYKEGYRYIIEIGEERIRRAGAKIKEEHPEVDTGFRVFKVDSSNIKEVAKTPGQVTQVELLEDERNIKEDRNDLDLLYQVMIDWGLEPSLPYELEQMNGVSVHNVFDGALIACFADELSESLIRSIAEKHPFRVVFKDSSFKDSAMKANVVQIFKEISPETKIKVL